jgi:hypothetical protein
VTRTIILIAVLAMLAPDEIRKKMTQVRQRGLEVQERFWRKYDEGVGHILDSLEERGIYKTKDYGTNKS